MSEKLKNIVKITEPIYTVLRLADSPAPTVGKIHARCLDVMQQLESGAETSLSATRLKQITKCFRERWEMLNSPLYLAGYALDPEFWDRDLDEATMEGLMTMVERLLSTEEQAAAMNQFADFRSKKGVLGRPLAINAAPTMPAYSWWQTFGAGVPQLQMVAVKVLAQPSSACACERNWSTYDFIHSKRRNRLTPQRADDLVYVFSSLRVRDRVQAVDYKANVVAWQQESSSGDEMSD